MSKNESDSQIQQTQDSIKKAIDLRKVQLTKPTYQKTEEIIESLNLDDDIETWEKKLKNIEM